MEQVEKECKCTHLPLNANADKGENRAVEADNQEEAVHATQAEAQQPAAVHHELDDLRHAEGHDDEVRGRQVEDEQVGDGLAHLAVSEDDEDDQGIAEEADKDDDKEKQRQADDGSQSQRVLAGEGRRPLGYTRIHVWRPQVAVAAVDGGKESGVGAVDDSVGVVAAHQVVAVHVVEVF